MNSERRRLTPQEKIAALKRHLLEGVPVSTICDELGIAPTLFYRRLEPGIILKIRMSKAAQTMARLFPQPLPVTPTVQPSLAPTLHAVKGPEETRKN